MSSILLVFKVLLIFYLIISTIALIKVRKLKGQGYDISFKDALNPIKWLSVFLGTILKYLFIDHIFEQLVVRFYNGYCRPNCLLGNGGDCTHCGCDTKAKMLVPFEQCSGGYWGKFMWSRKKYKEFREKYPITIKIEKNYGN